MNNDGTVNWVDDCHGDTYEAYPSQGVVYKVGHTHYCDNHPGGFNQPATWKFYRGMAFSKVATGVARKDFVGLHQLAGRQGPLDPAVVPAARRRDVHRPVPGRLVHHRQRRLPRSRG